MPHWYEVRTVLQRGRLTLPDNMGGNASKSIRSGESQPEKTRKTTALEDEQPKAVVDKQKDVKVELQEPDDSKNNKTLFRASRQLINRPSSAVAIDSDHLSYIWEIFLAISLNFRRNVPSKSFKLLNILQVAVFLNGRN